MILFRWAKWSKLLVLMSAFVWLVITVTDRYLSPNVFHPKVIGPKGKRTIIEEISRNNNTYIILFWTKYFQNYFDDNLTKAVPTIDSKHCSDVVPILGSSCVVTADRAYLPFSRALLYHWRDLNAYDLPAYRRSDQLWTLYNLEAPTYTNNLVDDRFVFNLTATYRTDSDIHVPYGRIVPRDKPLSDDFLTRINFSNKTKQIVWIVSNCETPSKRELYVRQLSDHIGVNIYGKCGTLSCDPPRSPHCLKRVSKEYKFFLSFENSICRDYVTEKLFETLNYDMIPVVFGGSDYKSLLPSNSFIDANSLSPQRLAQTLHQIGSDRNTYLSYFRWKRYYRVMSGLDFKFEVFCKLCLILNSQRTYQSHSAQDINNWWHRTADCKTWNNATNNLSRI